MLSKQQKIFVEEYFVKKKPAAEAAMTAGYAKNKKVGGNAARRLLKSKLMARYLLSCKMHGIDLENKRKKVIVADSERGGTTEWLDTFPEEKQDLRQGVFVSMTSKDELMEQTANSLNRKIQQLEAIIAANIPKPETPLEDRKYYNANAAISAIAEHNKMMGHHAPTKSVNLDIRHDPEVRKMLDLSKKFLLDFKKESEEEDSY